MIAFEEIEKLAYLNQPLPKFASLPEQFAYLCMRSLYGDYRKRFIGKDQAKTERDRIRSFMKTHKPRKTEFWIFINAQTKSTLSSQGSANWWKREPARGVKQFFGYGMGE